MLIHTYIAEVIRIRILLNVHAKNIPKEIRAQVDIKAESGPYVSYATDVQLAGFFFFLNRLVGWLVECLFG
jgi:hypothetical protein